MKRGFKAIALTLIFTFIFSLKTFAISSTNSDIKIDGNFDDWVGKPYLRDNKGDIKSPWLDFISLQYCADDKYLYLHVERQSAKKSEPWDFNVVIFNAQEEEERKEFDINSVTIGSNNSTDIAITVSYEGENLESTLSASNNGKEIEFRIPLDKVGLSGPNQQVEFALKSAIDRKTGSIDWLPNNGKIIVTTGPTLWKLAYIILFAGVTVIAFRVYKKKKSIV